LERKLRILGVDFGGTRIGIAVAETEPAIATPRPAIKASGTLRLDAKQILQLKHKEQAERIIVGLPFDENGEDTKMSRICRKLGDELTKLDMIVEFVDESFTSIQAQQALSKQDWTAATRKKYIDSEAACQILERYMKQLKEPNGQA
jgi:putative holliday junction resolvase